MRILGSFELKRSDGAVRNAAGNDEREIAKIGADVEREAMRADVLGDVDANGRNLLFCNAASGKSPDSRALADALRRNAEIFAGEDQSFFDETDEIDGAKVRTALAGKIAAEIEDGIADELAGAVIGDVSAALGLVNFNVFVGELRIGSEDVGAGGIASKREDGRVLKQQKRVRDEAGFARGDDFGLEAQAFRVADATEMKEIEDVRHKCESW